LKTKDTSWGGVIGRMPVSQGRKRSAINRTLKTKQRELGLGGEGRGRPET